MQWNVQLFIREHHNGHYSIEVLGASNLHVYAENLDTAREELELLLSDRLERLHPRHAGRYAVAEGLSLFQIELPEALVVDHSAGPENVSTKVSVLATRHRRWQQLWMPRWQLHYWIPVDMDPEEAIKSFLGKHLTKLSDHERLQLRIEGKEWLETLEVDAERPPLSAFTEKYLGVDMLPEPVAKDSDGDEEDERQDNEDEGQDDRKRDSGADDADGRKQKHKKKKKKKKKRPPTPTLKRIGVPMSKLAKDGELDRAFGRDREVDELLAMLQAPGATAFVVIGASGVGKTTALEELVYRLGARSSPKALRDRPVWFANASRLIAGDGWFGDWQRQCLDVIQECIDAEVIWYIGDVLSLLDAGKSIGSDQNVALLLRPFLAGRRITVVGECTPEKWSQVEQRDTSLARVFSTYRLEEPAREQTRTILAAVAEDLASEGDESGVPSAEIDTRGLQAVDDLCARYGSDKSQLGTSIHFLRRLFDQAMSRSEVEQRPVIIDRNTVVERFCAQTGMPAFLVRDDLPMDPQAVHQHFRQRLIGQEEAVLRMTDLVAMIKAGLSDSDRPLGSFLFVGPTGVGKTEMAKALTEFLFGRRDRLVRFDMSEFVSADSVHRFIGDGGQEGQLISLIRRSPFCVLLLDEIEKAHPAVFDVLLQVLGEARLTDHAGRTADFRNTVVLMTSNLGVDTFKTSAGFRVDAARSFREHFEAEAQKFFRPEFLGRIDYMVPFAPLERAAIDKITEREVSKFLAREGIRQRGLEVDLGTDVRTWLAENGVEPKYGARPLKRLIERSLTTPLAKHLSEHGSPAVAVNRIGEQLSFEGRETGRKAATAALGEVERFLARVRLIRYQVQRWLQSEPYRELVHSVRLIDRLSQDRNFWKDPAWAERRMRACERPRALRNEIDELFEQVASIEDLTFELYYDRNPEPLELLRQDFDQCVSTLDRLELELYGLRFERGDRATLLLQPSADGGPLLQQLIEIYCAVAEQRGWAIKGRHAFESVTAQKERQDRRARLAAADARKKNPRLRRERLSENPEDWTWRANHCKVPVRGPEHDDESYRKLVLEFTHSMTTGHGSAMCVLRVEGPHAAALLSAESGIHSLISDSTTPQVKVSFIDIGDTELPNPLDARKMFPGLRKRIIHDGRRTLQDPTLGLNLPMEPRLYKPYQRFMLAHMYRQLFGDDGYRIFRR